MIGYCSAMRRVSVWLLTLAVLSTLAPAMARQSSTTEFDSAAENPPAALATGTKATPDALAVDPYPPELEAEAGPSRTFFFAAVAAFFLLVAGAVGANDKNKKRRR